MNLIAGLSLPVLFVIFIYRLISSLKNSSKESQLKNNDEADLNRWFTLIRGDLSDSHFHKLVEFLSDPFLSEQVREEVILTLPEFLRTHDNFLHYLSEQPSPLFSFAGLTGLNQFEKALEILAAADQKSCFKMIDYYFSSGVSSERIAAIIRFFDFRPDSGRILYLLDHLLKTDITRYRGLMNQPVLNHPDDFLFNEIMIEKVLLFTDTSANLIPYYRQALKKVRSSKTVSLILYKLGFTGEPAASSLIRPYRAAIYSAEVRESALISLKRLSESDSGGIYGSLSLNPDENLSGALSSDTDSAGDLSVDR